VAKVGHGLLCSEVVSEGRDRQKVVVDSAGSTKTGPRKGDVIVRLGSLAVRNCFDVERALWDHKAGDKVQATVLRDGKVTTVLIPLAKAEPAYTAPIAARSR
jgi:S1-C subfamily serine protease